ncbi:TraB/GumN family protein [Tolypothrix campylonemoides VB511288]|nr:TraB/GumN family protein [Tolypothrix campylonemoides VB511288]
MHRMPATLLACAFAFASIAAAHAQGSVPAPAASPVAQPPQAASPPAGANDAAVDEDGVRRLGTVVVSGAQPGPGMWKVRNGANTLWILGTLTPLPRDFDWVSRDVEAVIAQADAVLAPPGAKFDADIGFFRGLTLLPTALRARNNPDGKRLEEVVPAPLYARWSTLKARYVGRDAGLEKRRPIVAAGELYRAAIRRAGLSTDDAVADAVRRATRKADLKATPVQVEFKIANAKDLLKELADTSLDDMDCFARTLDRVEGDIENMKLRANAWAVGDMDTLRALPYGDQFEACLDAVTGSALARKAGVADFERRVGDAWIAAARSALDRNAVTFATMPMVVMLRDDGPIARLRALGYAIEEP